MGSGFYDETLVEGVQEGISVDFWNDRKVWVRYYENGDWQSYFDFKPLDGFKEITRYGEKLSHLTGKTFDPNVFDSQEPQQTTYKPSQLVREEENLEQSERITALEKSREAHRSQGALGRLFGKQ